MNVINLPAPNGHDLFGDVTDVVESGDGAFFWTALLFREHDGHISPNVVRTHGGKSEVVLEAPEQSGVTGGMGRLFAGRSLWFVHQLDRRVRLYEIKGYVPVSSDSDQIKRLDSLYMQLAVNDAENAQAITELRTEVQELGGQVATDVRDMNEIAWAKAGDRFRHELRRLVRYEETVLHDLVWDKIVWLLRRLRIPGADSLGVNAPSVDYYKNWEREDEA